LEIQKLNSEMIGLPNPYFKARPLGDPDFVHPELLYMPPYAAPTNPLAARLRGEGVIDQLADEEILSTLRDNPNINPAKYTLPIPKIRPSPKRKLAGKGKTCGKGKISGRKRKMSGGSYNTAAIEGGSYNTAAIDGGSYNTAAIDGGSYNTAALEGGINFEFLKPILSMLSKTATESIIKIAKDSGESLNNLLKDPNKLLDLAKKHGPVVFKTVKKLLMKIPFIRRRIDKKHKNDDGKKSETKDKQTSNESKPAEQPASQPGNSNQKILGYDAYGNPIYGGKRIRQSKC